MNYWLVKSEPGAYSWSVFVKEAKTAWTGVRNFQARNNLRAMKKGDLVLFYHSGSEKRIVGLARVHKEAFVDPTAKEGDWSCVELALVKPLVQPVSLATIRAEKMLGAILLLRNSRLSVLPVNEAQFKRLLELGGTKV
jgi:predicted RNA-binding protein with PUA-like domain